MALGEVGVDLAPLIAGAGIVGIALGFGAQSLVKDFLSGIFMLLEDQFGVGDVIDCGEASGVVEGVSLRTTRLRDVEGTVWHVPNGQIVRVGNKSQEWSRALLDVQVAYDTDVAAKSVRSLFHPGTMLLSLQNGVDNEERIARLSGHPSGVGGVAYVVSAIKAPGLVAQTAGPGKIVLGELGGGESARTERLRDALQRAGIAAEVHPDIRAVLWQKFLFICAFSGVTALTRLPIGTVLADPATRALFRGTSEEVEAIARAIGIGLPDDCVEQALATASAVEPWGRGSLYGDLAGGRRLELEGLNGEVVRRGGELGIETPLNFAIYAALRPYVDGTPEPP